MNPPIKNAPRKILCAIASTTVPDEPGLVIAEADRRAAKQCLELAANVGAEVRFVHVVDFLDARGHDAVPLVQKLVRDELSPGMLRLIADAKKLDVEASYVFTRGKAWYKLLREAHRFSADLLVLSPRRDKVSFGDRVLHGSTAARVLRKAQCAVWVVDPRKAAAPKRVLALVDDTEVSVPVVHAAEMVAAAFGAERLALHCMDYPNDIVLIRMPNAQRAIDEYHDEVLEGARARLRKLTGGKPAGWTLLFEDDWVVRKAPDVVADQSIDMVVLGSLSNKALAGVLLGTTAEKLLERCQVSAFVVRPDDWVSPVQFDS
ncbi:MAG: universal stress protein [Deltaproteobacteria bacterium]|jgi:nucleotide-binding universal stress UspA family protein|nr:universal stress protein [Deltaproteobacteria bacterium]MBW2535036.1 universal stress protein [Deltaproteobacteria bacterium]